MKLRRAKGAISDDDAIDAIIRYHSNAETQTSIALRLGVDASTISRLVHGDSRPDLHARASILLAKMPEGGE